MRIVQTFWSGGGSLLQYSYGWPNAEFNLMSWALSCCSLCEHFKEVELYTDKRGYNVLIEKLQLPYTKVHIIYDDDLCLPQHWAYAKVKTYSMQEEPFLHVDGDMYFPKPISDEILSAQLIAQNREIGTVYYRSMMNRILRHPEIHLPQCISDSLKKQEIASYNMGIFGGHDIAFIRDYCNQSFEFLSSNHMNDPTKIYAREVCNILFEQVLFAVLADKEKRFVATIGRPVCDKGYTSYEFCNLTDYENKNFFHILGGHKGSSAICYALERILLKHYPKYFKLIIELFPRNHPRLFPFTCNIQKTSKIINDSFDAFLDEKNRMLDDISIETVLRQEIINTSFFRFVNQEKKEQLNYIIVKNPYIYTYGFTQEEIQNDRQKIEKRFTRSIKQKTLCEAVILPGIDNHKNKVIPITKLGMNVLALLEDKEKTYGELRSELKHFFSLRLQKHPKTLMKKIQNEIIFLAYNGIINIKQPKTKLI